jgi:hypothetical protein
MDADRQQRLEALPGWVWRVRIVNRIGWDEMYGRLIVYQRANGHCRVPKVYKTEDGNRLGQWVGYQRTRRDEMDPERRRRLDALGFDWDPRANERRPAHRFARHGRAMRASVAF